MPQIPRAHVREAAARPQQRFIDVIHIGQVRREDDLAALRPHDAVCDREKAMQVVIAVAAREQQMIGILNDERVMRAGDELDEDFVAFQGAFIRGVQNPRAVCLPRRQGAQDRTHQPGLAGTGAALEYQHGLTRLQISVHERRKRLAQRRIRFVVEPIDHQLIE